MKSATKVYLGAGEKCSTCGDIGSRWRSTSSWRTWTICDNPDCPVDVIWGSKRHTAKTDAKKKLRALEKLDLDTLSDQEYEARLKEIETLLEEASC